MKKLLEALNGKSALIVDIDELLFVDLLNNPLERLSCIEKIVGLPGFSDARIGVEEHGNIISLKNIYEIIHRSYREAEPVEIDLRFFGAHVDPEMNNFLGMAMHRKVQIYLCNNTGLPQADMERFLQKNGCSGYTKIYSPKTQDEYANICREIVQSNNIEPTEVLYVTNTEEACNVPGVFKYTWQPVLRRHGYNKNSAFFAALNSARREDAWISALENLISLSQSAGKLSDRWFSFGYKYIGLLAFEYVKFIGETVKKLKIRKVFFASENCFLIKAAFELMYPTIIAELVEYRNAAQIQELIDKGEILSETSAIVDMDRLMPLLGKLEDSRTRTTACNNPMAFWWEYTPAVCWRSGSLSSVNVGRGSRDNPNTNAYLYNILMLALAQPQSEIASKIYSGALSCVQELCAVNEKYKLPQSQNGIHAICSYLQNHIDGKDRALLEQAVTYCGNNKKWPIFKQGKPVVGIANPWPEDVSAEAEVITRLKRTAEENEIDCVLIDGFGHILTDKQGQTGEYINDESVSFVITTHYECAKVRNIFYYNPLWNPPEIPLNLSDYTPRVTNQFMMNDDFLIYDNGGMSNHLRSVLMNCPRTLEGTSALTASFPASAALPPKLEKPVMFYCGMNWEVMFGGPGRHDGLFKLLDDSRKVEIYGPERVEAWGGLKPWAGYHCYKGMIPFDGFSILERINECGICLVLSSDTHRRAGAATNRLYEACAAGAVIISDDNEFVLEHFKDAALFITFNKNDPIDTFRQIMEKYEWIVSHREEALKLAQRAQKIYLEKYSLDVQLNQIICNHPARFDQLSKDMFAQNEEKKVLVTFVLNTQKSDIARKWIDRVIHNLHGQIYQNMELAIAADGKVAESVARYCYTRCGCAHVIAMPLFDAKGVRAMTDGEAIRNMQKKIPHDYYINTTANEVWFFDHITALVRAISGEGIMCAYSGAAYEDTSGIRRVNFFDVLNASYLYHMNQPGHPLVAGQFLFRAEAHADLPDYLFGNLDGKEHMAYCGIEHYRCDAPIAFAKRMSLVYSAGPGDARGIVLSDAMQCRFIKDLLRFCIPEQAQVLSIESGEAGSIAKREMADLVLYAPLKVYLRLRFYRFCLRRKKQGTSAYKKYAEKYDACLEKYREYWNM